MERTFEATRKCSISFEGKPVLCKEVKMHVWEARSRVSRSYNIKGRSKGGPKKDPIDEGVAPTQKCFKIMRIFGINRLLPKIHQKLCTCHCSANKSPKKEFLSIG